MSFQEVIEDSFTIRMFVNFGFAHIKVFHSDANVVANRLAELDQGAVELVESISLNKYFLRLLFHSLVTLSRKLRP